MPRDPLRKTSQARRLRQDATPAEIILWKHLRDRRFDHFKFRRQKPIGPYIVDFVCVGCQVIVELDGETHLGREHYDARRDAYLTAQGYRVLRFWNNLVYDELDSVLEEIYLVCGGKK